MDSVGDKRETEVSEGEGTQTDTKSIELCVCKYIETLMFIGR